MFEILYRCWNKEQWKQTQRKRSCWSTLDCLRWWIWRCLSAWEHELCEMPGGFLSSQVAAAAEVAFFIQPDQENRLFFSSLLSFVSSSHEHTNTLLVFLLWNEHSSTTFPLPSCSILPFTPNFASTLSSHPHSSLFHFPFHTIHLTLLSLASSQSGIRAHTLQCTLSLLITIASPVSLSQPTLLLLLSSHLPSQSSLQSGWRNVLLLLRRAVELNRAALDQWLPGEPLAGKTWGWWGGGGRRAAPVPHRCLAGPPLLLSHHAGRTRGQLSGYLCHLQTQADEDCN